MPHTSVSTPHNSPSHQHPTSTSERKRPRSSSMASASGSSRIRRNSLLSRANSSIISSGSSNNNTSRSQADFLIKLCVIGEMNSGKTSLSIRFTAQYFDNSLLHTIGVEFYSKHIEWRKGGSRESPVGVERQESSHLAGQQETEKNSQQQNGGPEAAADASSSETTPEMHSTPQDSSSDTTLVSEGETPTTDTSTLVQQSQPPQHPVRHVLLQISDTAGSEAYSSITRNYFRNAHGILFVFDITSLESLQKLKFWIGLIQKDDPAILEGNHVVIVGNKVDLVKEDQEEVEEDNISHNKSQEEEQSTQKSEDQQQQANQDNSSSKSPKNSTRRHVTEKDVKKLLKQCHINWNHVIYREVSAKTGEGVDKLFLDVLDEIMERVEENLTAMPQMSEVSLRLVEGGGLNGSRLRGPRSAKCCSSG